MKFRVKTQKGSYEATGIVEAPDSQAAWQLALEASSQSSETVLSVTPVRWGVWCERLQTSKLGPAAAWAKKGEVREEFDNEEDARHRANNLQQASQSNNLRYTARELD